MLFELENNLCEKYSALTPFAIDEQKYTDVIELYANVITMNRRKIKYKPRYNKQGKRIIRRPAQNDNWF